MSALDLIVNRLADLPSIETSPSVVDGIPSHLEEELRYTGATLVQIAGVLLKKPQTTIATACILFQRFYVKSSFRQADLFESAQAALFLACKLCEQAVKPSWLLVTFHYVVEYLDLFTTSKWERPDAPKQYPPYILDPHTAQEKLFSRELQILSSTGFDTHVSLAYPLALNYLQVLDLGHIALLKQTVWNLLNDSLRSNLYVLQEPNAIGVASIWLAIRELRYINSKQENPDPSLKDLDKLTFPNWWALFDVDTQDLGHTAVLLMHTRELAQNLRDRALAATDTDVPIVPIYLEELEDWLKRARTA